MSERPSPTVVIVTALEVETRAVLRQLGKHTIETVNGTGFFRGSFEGWNVAVVEAGPGNAGAAAIAVCAIQHYNPDIALFVGVAGGVKDVAIGDVVVATKIYGYESGKDTGKGFQARPDVQNTAHELEHRARIIRQQDGWKKRLDPAIRRDSTAIFVAPIAAGEKVVASKRAATAKLIKEHYGDAIAVEMEGSGFLKGVHINHPTQGCVIRGVSDLLSGKANADKAGSQQRAADAASAAAFEILSGVNDGHGSARKSKPAFVEMGFTFSKGGVEALQMSWASASARIFISYSRKDGIKFAAKLRDELQAEDLTIWQDVVALEGGRDWWSQIEDALRSKSLQHLVLIVTPAALQSATIRKEIRLARQEGKQVSPVRGPGLDDLSALPRWLGQLYDLDLKEHRATLLRVLQAPSRQERVAMMAPEPPGDFVARPRQFEAIKTRLLDAKRDAVAITAAIRGAGGYGKSTLAKALAHDPDIQDAYFDGILWAELGKEPDNLLATIADLIERMTGVRPEYETVNAAASALGEVLSDRRILLVVDDVWRQQDLLPFMQAGPRTTRLVTTRIDSTLPSNVWRHVVDAMEANEAVELLAHGLPKDQVAAANRDLVRLAARLGEWAQLLKLVNGFLRDRVVNGGLSVAGALVRANERLKAKGLDAFGSKKPEDRTEAVASTIRVSVELLDEAGRARFGELGIFPEDADIPVGIVGRLWGETGGVSYYETEDLLSELNNLSLLLNLDLELQLLHFHDTVRSYLQTEAGEASLRNQHQRLVHAMGDIRSARKIPPAETRYYYLHLLHHLAAGGDREMLDSLMLDPEWLKAKLAATGSPHAIVSDFQQYGRNSLHELVGRTLRLITGICARDNRQLLPQLFGRLIALQTPELQAFIDRVHALIEPPAVVPVRPRLRPPRAEAARLEDHKEWVNALALLPDGRLALGSGDGTIRLWDLKTGSKTAHLNGAVGEVTALAPITDGYLASGSGEGTVRLLDIKTGAETGRFQGHVSKVTALTLLPDGRLASGSGDSTVRLWDLTRPAESARLEGHTDWVNALALLPDGRLASGSGDGTVRLWDVTTGTETACLKGHTGAVFALAVLPNGQLASGSLDMTVRLWDLTTGAEPVRLEGHTGWVVALALLPDGRLASGSYDQTVRLWDVKTGAEAARLEGHFGWVLSLALLSDNRLASSSGDFTVRLWDLKTGAETVRLEGDMGGVAALVTLPDGRLASGSRDKTIRLWDLGTGAETVRLQGHTDWVNTIALLPNDRLASGSRDKTVRVWDIRNGTEISCLQGHTAGVDALEVLLDGGLASGSRDTTVRLWDLRTGTETARLEGHTDRVNTLALLPNNRLASGSGDNTVRLWDLRSGAEIGRLEGHKGAVFALALLSDGRLASGSGDGTVRLWDLTTGTEVGCLEGHTRGSLALASLPDGRLASGSGDNMVRLWDSKTCKQLCRFEVDAPVISLAVLRDNQIVAGDQLGRLHWLQIIV